MKARMQVVLGNNNTPAILVTVAQADGVDSVVIVNNVVVVVVVLLADSEDNAVEVSVAVEVVEAPVALATGTMTGLRQAVTVAGVVAGTIAVPAVATIGAVATSVAVIVEGTVEAVTLASSKDPMLLQPPAGTSSGHERKARPQFGASKQRRRYSSDVRRQPLQSLHKVGCLLKFSKKKKIA